MSIDNQNSDIEDIPVLPEAPADASALTPELTSEARTGVFIKIGHWINKNWLHKGITIGVGASIVGGAITGVAASEGAFTSPDKQTTHSAGPTSGPTHTPEATSIPETRPASLDVYYDESVATFIARPVQERINGLCAWEGRQLTTVGNEFYANSKNKIDKMPIVSKTNTPQQIVSANNEIAVLASSTQDVNLAQKILSCAFEDPANDPVYASLAEAITNFNNRGNPPQAQAHDDVNNAPVASSWEAPVEVSDGNGGTTVSQEITSQVNDADKKGSITNTYVLVAGANPMWVTKKSS